jgi:hypothetical protein
MKQTVVFPFVIVHFGICKENSLHLLVINDIIRGHLHEESGIVDYCAVIKGEVLEIVQKLKHETFFQVYLSEGRVFN